MSLHMLSFRPDFARLARLAVREKLLPPGGDPGYAVHAVLAASFGELAPKPFLLLAPGETGGGPAGRLIAYSAASLETLRARAEEFADPAFSAVLQLPEAEAKPMPERFAAGRRLGFRLRVRPVVRTGRPRDAVAAGGDVAERTVSPESRGRERDAFLAAIEGTPPDAGPTRPVVYAEWLAGQLERGGARLASAALDGFAFARLMVRDRSADASRRRFVTGPDCRLSGTLTVEDPEAFAAGLARGIGRYRSFGFGMLILTPP